tara:strand:- start:12759 stop:13577 length:819 start_codon:yes stop_codon:yes gene_type:complete
MTFKKYCKGNKNADLKIISLGMGVQSTAVYLMSSMKYKLPRADYAIFSDPQAEHYKTYEMLEWLLSWQKENNGIPIVVNRDNNLYKDIIENYKNGSRVASIPAHTSNNGLVRRQCTEEYKIKPVIKSARDLHKLKYKQRMKPTELWLGISTDEIQRLKESSLYNIKYFYPLIYHGMSRVDCMNFFKKNNFPVPIKSSCVFCPFHSDKFWRSIKKENGDAWKISLEVDKAIRVHPKMNEKQYLNRQCKPLDEADLNENQTDLFIEECEGYCGL